MKFLFKSINRIVLIILALSIYSCISSDLCDNMICQNDGLCINGTCHCDNGFSGRNCEIEDLCRNTICQNDGVCIDGICDCPDGFIGIDCDIKCDEGYKGENCQKFDLTKIQALLDSGVSVFDILNTGITPRSLYGKRYQGGIIFFIDVEDQHPDFNGLVASPEDLGLISNWGCNGIDLEELPNISIESAGVGDGADVGFGKSNTEIILRECNEIGTAASLCRELGKEWFLPSIQELNLMNAHLASFNIGDFSRYRSYVSSTELNDSEVFCKFMIGDYIDPAPKEGRKLKVRAARHF